LISAGLAFHFNHSIDSIKLITYCHKVNLPCFQNVDLQIFIQMVSSEVTSTLWKGFEGSFFSMY